MLWAPSAVVALLLFFTNAIIDTVVVSPQRIIIFGKWSLIFVVHFVAYMTVSFYILFKKYRQLSGIPKMQIAYVIYGTAVTSILASITNLFSPLSGDFSYFFVGPIFTLVMVGSFMYAIIQYQLMNIRLVVSRIVQYAFSFVTSLLIIQATLYLFGAFERNLLHPRAWLVGALLAVLVILLHDLFSRFFIKVTDNIFFRGQPDYQKFLEEIGHSIAEEVSQDGLINSASTMLRDQLKVEHAHIWVLNESRGVFEVRNNNELSINLASPLVKFLEQSRSTLVTEELDLVQGDTSTQEESVRLGGLVAELHQYNIALARRVMLGGKLMAISTLGPKLSKDVFDREVVELFDVVAPQIATALARTKLYDEAQQFNIKLKSEIEKATSELQVANKHLQQLDQSKSEFLSIAAHQLRTPLTGIKGYVSMFLEGDFGAITQEQREQLERVFRSSDRLTRLIDVFLDVSRIETGRLELTKSPVKLEEIIDEVVGDLQNQAKAKKLELTVQKPDEPLPEILIDRDKIHDVMMNLVDNAIKYTPKGWINVRLSRSKSFITFEVRDSGIGIDPIEMDRLFQKFTRAEAVTRIHTGGSGLGLFIAKKIIEAHAGRIWTESEGEGKGALFTFTLPIDVKGDHA